MHHSEQYKYSKGFILKRDRIETLTSLRFFAAVLVAAGHAGFYPGFEYFKFSFINFATGVSFFFVLSGFILSLSYKKMIIKDDYGNFLIARFARVWPLHVITGLFCLFIFGPNIFSVYGGDYTNAFIANVFLVHGWIPFSHFYFSYNAVSWSVSVEFFFYIFFPFLLVLHKRYGWGVLIMPITFPLIISFYCAYYNIPLYGESNELTSSSVLYINPISRMAEFALGMLLYYFYEKKSIVLVDNDYNKTKWTLIEIFSFFILVTALILAKKMPETLTSIKLTPFLYWYSAAGSFLFFGILILVFSLKRGSISKLLSIPFFVYLGEISFAIYMTHQIVLNYFNAFHLDYVKLNPILMYVVFWVITISVSIFLYHLLEIPSRKIIRALFFKKK